MRSAIQNTVSKHKTALKHLHLKQQVVASTNCVSWLYNFLSPTEKIVTIVPTQTHKTKYSPFDTLENKIYDIGYLMLFPQLLFSTSLQNAALHFDAGDYSPV